MMKILGKKTRVVILMLLLVLTNIAVPGVSSAASSSTPGQILFWQQSRFASQEPSSNAIEMGEHFHQAFTQGLKSNEKPVTPTAEQQEAMAFFQHLIQTSKNPTIVAMAKQNFARLTHAEGEAFAKQQASPATLATQSAPSYEPTHAAAVNTTKAAIPLFRRGNKNIMLQAMVNQKALGMFMMDTGATYTVITPLMAKRLGLTVPQNAKTVRIRTANGLIQAPMVTIDKLSLGTMTRYNVQALVCPLGTDPMLAGVLGMNAFEGMDFSVKGNQLLLSKAMTEGF